VPPQTASAAGRPNVPANTPSRANSTCSPGDSRSKLQSSVFFSVRCRSGRSRAPAVSTCSRSPSRASSAEGGSILTLAAASSMASGRPSSRRQICATAWALSPFSSKPGDAARARSANRCTEGYCQRSAVSMPAAAAGGTGSGSTENSCSPLSLSTLRLVTITVSPGAAVSRSPIRGAASLTCSKLSITSSTRLACRYAMTSVTSLPAEVLSPSPAAIAAGTRSADWTGARSMNRTPPGNSGRSLVAACMASLLFPTPPGPVRLISRAPCPSTRSAIAAVSCWRSTSGVAGAGSAPASGGPVVSSRVCVMSKRSLSNTARSFSTRRCRSAASENRW